MDETIKSSTTDSTRCRHAGPVSGDRLSGEIDAIMGRPWSQTGRGPETFSCLGVFLYLVERVTGVCVEDPYTMLDGPGVAKLWLLFRHIGTARLRSLDLLYLPQERLPGLYTVEDEQSCVTSSRTRGVHRETLWRVLSRDVQAYRLKRLEW